MTLFSPISADSTREPTQPSLASGEFGVPEGKLDAKQKLLLAAGPIFAENGFRDSTVREICDRAGVNVASVNYHFGDKQGLYHETVLMARQLCAQQPGGLDWSDALTRVADDDHVAQLRVFVQLILRRMVVDSTAPWQVQLLLNEIQNPTQTCEQLAREYFQPFMEALIQRVRQIAEVPLSQTTASKLALSVVGQCMIYRFAGQATKLTLGDVFDSETDPVKTSPSGSDPSVDQKLESLTDLITQFSIAGIRHAASIGQPTNPTS